MEAGVMRRVVELTVHQNVSIQNPALRVMNNITKLGNPLFTQVNE